MQHQPPATRAWLSSESSLATPVRSAERVRPRSGPDRGGRSGGCAILYEVRPVGVEYLVRTARITDIDRLVALSVASARLTRDDGPMDPASLLRQLVYLPQASIFVAEARREVVGGAVLALRPSVRAGGYVGTVDLLVVDPEHDVERISAALIGELLRSAGNKGCTVVETGRPNDSEERTRWEQQGFKPADPHMERAVSAVGVPARRAQ